MSFNSHYWVKNSFHAWKSVTWYTYTFEWSKSHPIRYQRRLLNSRMAEWTWKVRFNPVYSHNFKVKVIIIVAGVKYLRRKFYPGYGCWWSKLRFAWSKFLNLRRHIESMGWIDLWPSQCTRSCFRWIRSYLYLPAW